MKREGVHPQVEKDLRIRNVKPGNSAWKGLQNVKKINSRRVLISRFAKTRALRKKPPSHRGRVL